MSKFKRTIQALDNVSETLSALEGLAISDIPPEELLNGHQRTQELADQLTGVAPAMEKFIRIARITDVEKQQYGKNMVAQVLAEHGRFEELKTRIAQLQDGLSLALAPVKDMLEAAEAAERAAGERSRAAKAEEEQRQARERVKLQEERERQKEERRRREELEAKEGEMRRQQDREEYERIKAKEEKRKEELVAALKGGTGVLGAISFIEALRTLNKRGGSLTASLCALLLRIVVSLKRDAANSPYRELRVMDEEFQQNLGGAVGGEECLIALGYRYQFDLKQGKKWVLKEPDEEADPASYLAWRKELNKADALLRDPVKFAKLLR